MRSSLLWLALVPPCLTAFLILRLGVDVPFLDEWRFIPLFQKLDSGELGLGDLLEQHNEHRMVVPRLLCLGLAQLSGWDTRWEMLAILGMAGLTSWNLFVLARRALPDQTTVRYTLHLLTSLILFSPIQWETWLDGIQMVFFLPALCLTTALVVAGGSLSHPSKLTLCSALATSSTYSSSNGILCWFLMAPALVLSSRTPRARRWSILVCLAGFALTAAIYIVDFRSRPPGGHDPAKVGPGGLIGYFLSVTGNSLCLRESLPLALQHPCYIPIATSLFLIPLYLVSLMTALHRRERRALPWLLLGAYSLTTAAMIALGRHGLGLEQSLTSRYISYTLYLPVALLHLVAILFPLPSSRPRTGVILAVAVGGLLLLPYPHQTEVARSFRRFILEMKSHLLFVRWIPEAPDLRRISPAPHPQFLRWAEFLDSRGFLRPPLLDSPVLESIEVVCQAPCEHGAFGSLVESADGTWIARGRATLPGRGETADAVVLAWSEEPGRSIAFALAAMHAPPGGYPDGSPAWEISVSPLRVPESARQVSAWAIDAVSGKAHRLPGLHPKPLSP